MFKLGSFKLQPLTKLVCYIGSMKKIKVEKRVRVSLCIETNLILFHFIFIFLLRPERFLVEWKITEIREMEEDGRRRGERCY